jgi:hypothetical protein
MGEHGSAVLRDVFVKQDACLATKWARQRSLPVQEREIAAPPFAAFGNLAVD